MKKYLLALLCLFVTTFAISQISEVKYQIEINDVTGNYDCNLIITGGSAMTVPQRIQFNSQFTIVVPTGTNFSFIESLMPLIDNADFNGTVPITWNLSNSVIAPAEQPESDFYAFAPDLAVTSHYNNLQESDVITLFTVSADVGCNLDIRPLDNDLDATIINGDTYMQGFTIGSATQTYVGNEIASSFDADINVILENQTICPGECVTLTPIVECAPIEGLAFEWSTGETTESIEVCPDVTSGYWVAYRVNGMSFNLSEVENVVTVGLDITAEDTELCEGETAQYGPEGIWTSSDETVVVVTNTGLVSAIGLGTATLSISNPDLVCEDEVIVTVYSAPTATITGSELICINGQTQASPFTGGTWFSADNSIATITNDGVVTGVQAGTTTLTFTTTDGCSDNIDITVLENPAVNAGDYGPYCISGLEIELEGSPSGGIFSGVGVNGQFFNIGVAGIGIHTITYDYANNAGCVGTATTEITVVEIPPLPAIEAPSEFCLNTDIILSVLPSGFNYSSYQWTGPNGFTSTGEQIVIPNATIDFDGVYSVYGVGENCSSDEVTIDVFLDNCDGTSALVCEEAEIICDMDLLNGFTYLMPTESSPGDQPLPLCPDGGAPHNISWIGFIAPSGDYTINVVPTNCFGSTTGQEGVQTGLYTDCTYADAVFCNSDCNLDEIKIPSSILTPGEDYFFFIDGCSQSVCYIEIYLDGQFTSECEDPCEDVESEWTFAPAGEFNQDYNIASYATASGLLDDGMDHLVFYDYTNGDVYLKVNTGQGTLDQEILMFNNEAHYENGEYIITLEDIDQNGLTDLILAELNNPDGDKLTLYENLGGGDFGKRSSLQVCGMAGPRDIHVYDFDNDGTKDIFYVCLDKLYGHVFIEGWEMELQEYNDQTFCNVFVGDLTGNDYLDVGFTDGNVLINDSDRIFAKIPYPALDLDCNDSYYYEQSTKQIVGSLNTFQIVDQSDFTSELCADHTLGDPTSAPFLSNITSPLERQIVIADIDGFHSFSRESVCEDFFPNTNGIEAVQARERTQIDMTLNGCTDFLVINGNQIGAWINPKSTGKISGIAYIDKNENGMYDSNEDPLRNVLVSTMPGDFTILTGDDGSYCLALPQGEYSLKAQVNEGEWVDKILSIDNIVLDSPCLEGINFGFVQIETPIPSATISMVNSIARCDFETRFDITVENTGSEPLGGTLQFEFDDKTSFFSSEIPGYQVNGNMLFAEIGPLAPFQPQNFQVILKMPSGTASLPMLDFKASLLNDAEEAIAENGYSEQLRCSYDPNDKRSFPDREGEENLTLLDEDIEYTIRFQNNGNDTAFTVTIIDLLDPSIDPNSIRVVSASHSVETCIEDNELIFLFEDIFLVDSTTNYAASQGYVTFRCNAKEGVAEFTEAFNQADIVFDTNIPIVTNQTLNTLVSELCTDKETTIDYYICEGESYEGFTVSGTYTVLHELPLGCDSTVTINLEVQGISLTSQDIGVCAGIEIFIDGTPYVFEESTEILDTSINILGCITSITTYNILVIQDLFTDQDLGICLGGEDILIDLMIPGTWTSSDETIISVTADGILTTVNPGTANLIFTDNENGCLSELPVEVFAQPQVSFEDLDEVCPNNTTNVTANLDGTWISTDPTIATVSIDGEVTGVSSGMVDLIFTDNVSGCVSEALSLTVLPENDPVCIVAVHEIDPSSVILYPNPTTSSLFIQTDKLWIGTDILDIEGRVIKHYDRIENKTTEINVSTFPAGVYTILFRNEEGVLAKRFVVQ